MLPVIVYYGLYGLFRLLELAVFAYCILSWFVRPGSGLYNVYAFLARILEPMFVPARKFQYWLMRRLNINIPIDFSPWITLLVLDLIFDILVRLLFFRTRIY